MKSQFAKLLLGILLIATLVLSACQNGNKTQTNKPIKIGLIAPLSGDAAVYGINPEKGARLAIEEINNNGGINGIKLELITEDSECDPAKGANAIQKLININKTKYLIGGMCSSVTLAIAPTVESNKIVAISPVSTNYKVSEAGDYIFRTVPSDAMQGKKGAQVAREINKERAAILYINNDYGAGLEKIFRQEFEKLGGQVVLTESHPAGEVDFKAQLAKIISMNLDVLYLPTMSESALIAKQLRTLGSDIQIIGTETMQDKQVVIAADKALEGTIFTSFSEYEGLEAQTFEQSYQTKYNEEKGIFSDYAYDAVYSVVKAIKNCEDLLDTECVKNELYKVNFTGATGWVEFDQNGDPKGKSFSVFKIEDGEFVEL